MQLRKEFVHLVVLLKHPKIKISQVIPFLCNMRHSPANSLTSKNASVIVILK